MAQYEAFLQNNPVNGLRDLVLVPDGATAPANHTSIGVFEHDGTALHKTHDIYYHIRDLLYYADIYDMQKIIIKYHDEILPLSFSLDNSELEIEMGSTGTTNIRPYPGHSNMGNYTVSSSATGVATVAVNNTTKVITVTAVAVGSATITVGHSIIDMEQEIAVTVVEAS